MDGAGQEPGGGEPHGLLDGGGEGWPRLRAALARRLQPMEAGQVLEIITAEPSARREIPAWCAANGQYLVGMRDDHGEMRFWIRRGD